MFALVDCNNFYVSCERVFNPLLDNKPVIVLSNNDGCIIARSNEAKILGFKMGDPLFQRKELIRQHGVVVYSSNYHLYGDMSRRVITLLKEFSPRYEIYSIDEMFLGLKEFEQWDLIEYGRKIKERIAIGLKIPVSVGIGPTKTLAKLANFYAKNDPAYAGVCTLEEPPKTLMLLKQIPIEKVWGVGRQWSDKLKQLDILSAYDLAQADSAMIKRKFSVVLARTILELQGTSCIKLESVMPRKNIMVSRSFGQPIIDFIHLREAVANFATRAAEKLRNQKSYACAMMIFIRTNSFNKTDKQYSNSICLKFPKETDNTMWILKTATQGLKLIFRKGVKYKKAGTMLIDIISNQTVQADLFIDDTKMNNKKLMDVIDAINEKYGKDTIRFAICGCKKTWSGRQQKVSPAYTTRWRDILVVFAK
ncbi:MAG: Y-family DNA polymerase [Proteobacteria bacterium]|nr:Y-family DNA polymerase [Pseudomonadota bacterium]